MKEIIAIYKKQRTFVENSLKAMIDSIDLSQYDEMKDKTIFSLFPALKATYKINENYKQSTPVYMCREVNKDSFGLDMSHFLSRIQFSEDNIYISNSYVNSRSATDLTTLIRTKNRSYS